MPPSKLVLKCFVHCIVAVDMNPAQNALLEFKIAAIKQLCYENYLIVLGDKEDTEQKRFSNYHISHFY
jgi:S-adenosylmethionine:diacylglycerol 3-amino-3-carboxypropyl transferase